MGVMKCSGIISETGRPVQMATEAPPTIVYSPYPLTPLIQQR
jgi:hypothetical protein